MAAKRKTQSPLKTFAIRTSDGSIAVYRSRTTPTVTPNIDLYASVKVGRTAIAPVATLDASSTGLFKGLKVNELTEVTGVITAKE
jgi:hypothetical protein